MTALPRPGRTVLRTRLRGLGLLLMTVLALAVALLSFRYVLPHPPEAPKVVTDNPFARPWLPVHAILSATALLAGAVQFVLPRRGTAHRWLGRVYVGACLLSAPAGLILAAGATTGPVSSAGFGTLAVVWFAVTALGWQAAVERRFADHRRWMVRSYALSFGGVLLRLYLVPVLAWHLDFDWWYRLISFATWVPNLLVVEFWLWSERARRPLDRALAGTR